MSEKLQLEADLTLEKAIATVRQSESIRKQQPLLRSGDKPEIAAECSINAVKKQQSLPSQRGRDSRYKKYCTRCGKSPNHDYKVCPARDVICHKCSQQGHFKRYCKSAKVQEVYEDRGAEDSSDDTVETFIGVVGSQQESPMWTVDIMMNNCTAEFSIDTGADVTVIPEQLYKETFSSRSLQATSRTLCGPGHYTLPVTGKFMAKLRNGSHESDETIYVVKNLRRPLLGRPAIESLDLLKRINTIKSTNVDVKLEFPQLFTGLGRLQGHYHICLKDGAKPYSLNSTSSGSPSVARSQKKN